MPKAHSSARAKAADGGRQRSRTRQGGAGCRAGRGASIAGMADIDGRADRPACNERRNCDREKSRICDPGIPRSCPDGQAGLAAGELRIAAWNLEHLKDGDGEGCVGRTGADYAAIAGRLAALDAGIVALQEVENAAAAHRVFPASRWRVEMSLRPAAKRSLRCRGRPSARLGHLATGFAIRRGIGYRRNPDLKALGMGKGSRRWGTDITVTMDGR